MRLIVGNKNYSSWSMRPWLVLKALGLPFDEEVIPLGTDQFARRISEVSGANRVPVLIDGDVVIWESLAIIEYISDRFPDHAVWPADRRARAHARAAASEMHAGFTGLRSACPMNHAKSYAKRDRGAEVAADVNRIETLWREARTNFGAAGGPFLYGAFSAADAMYAPVVSRFQSYQLSDDAVAAAYMQAITSHPAYVEWRQAGLSEPWIVDEDEVDEPAVEDLRSGRADRA